MPSWLGKNHWEGRRQAGAGPDTRKVRDTLAGTFSFIYPCVMCHVSPRLLTNFLRFPDRLICLSRIDQAERFA